MDTDTKALALALALMLAAFPMTSLGTDRDMAWLWMAGLVVLAAGALIPPVTRYALNEEEDE